MRKGASIRAVATAATMAATGLAAGQAAAQKTIADLGPGDIFAHCQAFCPEMVLIKGGDFEMGSPEEEPGRDVDEGPTRVVTVAPFALAITETTYTQWDACVADGFCRKVASDPSFGDARGQLPVVAVSWRDIVGTPRFADEKKTRPLPPTDGFVAWLNSKVPGRPYRLPSEAEWEFAARAGSDAAHHTGARISALQANFNPKPLVGDPAKGPTRTNPVVAGGLPANDWGLFEMPGNVWEWVQDCYSLDYRGASETAEALEETGCRERVLRGGAFNTFEVGVRSANRLKFDGDATLASFGFRIAYDLKAAGFECDEALLRCTPLR